MGDLLLPTASDTNLPSLALTIIRGNRGGDIAPLRIGLLHIFTRRKWGYLERTNAGKSGIGDCAKPLNHWAAFSMQGLPCSIPVPPISTKGCQNPPLSVGLKVLFVEFVYFLPFCWTGAESDP